VARIDRSPQPIEYFVGGRSPPCVSVGFLCRALADFVGVKLPKRVEVGPRAGDYRGWVRGLMILDVEE
jgi:hypothetical protein